MNSLSCAGHRLQLVATMATQRRMMAIGKQGLLLLMFTAPCAESSAGCLEGSVGSTVAKCFVCGGRQTRKRNTRLTSPWRMVVECTAIA